MKTPVEINPLLPPNTFQYYIDAKYNIKTLGPYDYMAFCKKMREQSFKSKLYEEYQSIK
jgi:hypothetical protein